MKVIASIILALLTLSTKVFGAAPFQTETQNMCPDSRTGAGPLRDALEIKAGVPPTRAVIDEDTFRNYVNLVGKVKGVVYLDLQCKQTAEADEIHARARFAIPNSRNSLIKVQFAGVCDNFCVGRIFLSDPYGNILDVIETDIQAYPGIVAKNYTMENGRVQVYSIMPCSQATMLFDDFGHSFSTFEGIRCDEEYIVDGDRFRLVKRTVYAKKTYNYSDLYQPDIETHIWEGGETVERVENFN